MRVSQLQSPQHTTHNRPRVAKHRRKPHPCPRYPASPMVPPFVMTTEQWVNDPVEEFNLPGTGQAAASPDERHRTARVSSPPRSPLLRSPLRQLRHVRAGGLRLSHGGVPSAEPPSTSGCASTRPGEGTW